MPINKHSTHFLTFHGVVPRGRQLSAHFKVEEVSDPFEGCALISLPFLSILDQLRRAVDRPIILNSACRLSSTNDRLKNSVKSSLHLVFNPKWQTQGCIAADISVENWSQAELTLLLEKARYFDLSIGHGYNIKDNGRVSGFVHVDDRTAHLELEQTEFYY